MSTEYKDWHRDVLQDCSRTLQLIGEVRRKDSEKQLRRIYELARDTLACYGLIDVAATDLESKEGGE
ncbi:MAG: hypothetical protein ACYTEQ_01040 [Planctomycetota bacterium]|jgi:hypothetical protein